MERAREEGPKRRQAKLAMRAHRLRTQTQTSTLATPELDAGFVAASVTPEEVPSISPVEAPSLVLLNAPDVDATSIAASVAPIDLPPITPVDAPSVVLVDTPSVPPVDGRKHLRRKIEQKNRRVRKTQIRKARLMTDADAIDRAIEVALEKNDAYLHGVLLYQAAVVFLDMFAGDDVMDG
jgi:hypothetical protein